MKPKIYSQDIPCSLNIQLQDISCYYLTFLQDICCNIKQVIVCLYNAKLNKGKTEMRKKKKLVRQQLETTLQKFRFLLAVSIPPKGWIRAIRDALGMSARQLSNRLGVTQQRVAEIERDELGSSATLKTMRRVAECLDCVFVYTLIPRTSMEQTLREQARQVAKKRLSRVSHTMRLENQELSDDDQEQAMIDMIEELIENQPSTLWDEHNQS